MSEAPNSGWMHVTGSFFPIASGIGAGHMAGVVRNYDLFGFADLDEVRGASELGRDRDLSDASIDDLCSILDGDQGLWETLYDRGWVRVVHTAQKGFGIVVESESVGRRVARHLADQFGVTDFQIDLFDRRTNRVHASYTLDGEALGIFLRHGRLRQDWCIWQKAHELHVAAPDVVVAPGEGRPSLGFDHSTAKDANMTRGRDMDPVAYRLDAFAGTDFNFGAGHCDAFALALFEETGLPLALISRSYPDPEGEDGDLLYESSHAVVMVDEHTIMDVYGVRSFDEAALDCLWVLAKDSVPELVPASEEDVEYAFSMCGADEQAIAAAKDVIARNPELYAVPENTPRKSLRM